MNLQQYFGLTSSCTKMELATVVRQASEFTIHTCHQVAELDLKSGYVLREVLVLQQYPVSFFTQLEIALATAVVYNRLLWTALGYPYKSFVFLCAPRSSWHRPKTLDRLHPSPSRDVL